MFIKSVETSIQGKQLYSIRTHTSLLGFLLYFNYLILMFQLSLLDSHTIIEVLLLYFEFGLNALHLCPEEGAESK